MAALLCMHIRSPGVFTSYFPASHTGAGRSACLAQEKNRVLHCKKVKEDKDLTPASKPKQTNKKKNPRNKKKNLNKTKPKKPTKHNITLEGTYS